MGWGSNKRGLELWLGGIFRDSNVVLLTWMLSQWKMVRWSRGGRVTVKGRMIPL